MEQWQGKVALVTGASGGIGSNICIHLCQLGMNVVGCDIDTTRIEVCFLIVACVGLCFIMKELYSGDNTLDLM